MAGPNARAVPADLGSASGSSVEASLTMAGKALGVSADAAVYDTPEGSFLTDPGWEELSRVLFHGVH